MVQKREKAHLTVPPSKYYGGLWLELPSIGNEAADPRDNCPHHSCLDAPRRAHGPPTVTGCMEESQSLLRVPDEKGIRKDIPCHLPHMAWREYSVLPTLEYHLIMTPVPPVHSVMPQCDRHLTSVGECGRNSLKGGKMDYNAFWPPPPPFPPRGVFAVSKDQPFSTPVPAL